MLFVLDFTYGEIQQMDYLSLWTELVSYIVQSSPNTDIDAVSRASNSLIRHTSIDLFVNDQLFFNFVLSRRQCGLLC